MLCKKGAVPFLQAGKNWPFLTCQRGLRNRNRAWVCLEPNGGTCTYPSAPLPSVHSATPALHGEQCMHAYACML